MIYLILFIEKLLESHLFVQLVSIKQIADFVNSLSN